MRRYGRVVGAQYEFVRGTHMADGATEFSKGSFSRVDGESWVG